MRKGVLKSFAKSEDWIQHVEEDFRGFPRKYRLISPSLGPAASGGLHVILKRSDHGLDSYKDD